MRQLKNIKIKKSEKIFKNEDKYLLQTVVKIRSNVYKEIYLAEEYSAYGQNSM